VVYHSGVDVGQLLREARRERGLGQAALARRAGTTQTYISRIERGDVSPSGGTLRRLLHAMGLELSTRPLSYGNVALHELRADFRDLTPAERVEQAMELSDFLLGVAERAR
jgi:transcriptional regulator with XRE-family HTH domain